MTHPLPDTEPRNEQLPRPDAFSEGQLLFLRAIFGGEARAQFVPKDIDFIQDVIEFLTEVAYRTQTSTAPDYEQALQEDDIVKLKAWAVESFHSLHHKSNDEFEILRETIALALDTIPALREHVRDTLVGEYRGDIQVVYKSVAQSEVEQPKPEVVAYRPGSLLADVASTLEGRGIFTPSQRLSFAAHLGIVDGVHSNDFAIHPQSLNIARRKVLGKYKDKKDRELKRYEQSGFQDIGAELSQEAEYLFSLLLGDQENILPIRRSLLREAYSSRLEVQRREYPDTPTMPELSEEQIDAYLLEVFTWLSPPTSPRNNR